MFTKCFPSSVYGDLLLFYMYKLLLVESMVQYIYIYDAIASLYSETFSLVCQNNIHTNWFLFSKGDNASLILSILLK